MKNAVNSGNTPSRREGETPLLQKGKGIILSQKSRKKVAKKSQLYSILLVKTEKR